MIEVALLTCKLEVARDHAKVMSHDEVTYVTTADTLS